MTAVTMTPRERLMVASRGGEADRKPIISWDGSDSEADAIVVAPNLVKANIGERVVLAEVPSPFSIYGTSLNALLREDPESGSAKLDAAVEITRQLMEQAMSDGADGIFYCLYGATADNSTPMEYGGFYLERDRELLESVSEATLNVLFLVGKEDLYYDFVSDLPANVIAWDFDLSGITSKQIRFGRPGAQASSDPASEIILRHPGLSVADRLARY